MGKISANVAKAAFVLMAFTAVSNALGLIRESTLAAYFGASPLTDAYKIAFVIPYMLLSSISSAISTTFIPVYTEYKRSRSVEQVQYFLNNIFNTTAIITILLMAAGMIFAPFIVDLIAPGFKPEIYNMTVKLTVIMMPSLVFLALSSLAGGYLQSNNRFTATAFIGIPFNLFIIGSIVFPFNRGIEIVAAGSLLGICSQLLIQIPSITRAGYHLKPVFLNFKEEGIRRIFILTIPILIGSVFNHVYLVIDRILASGLDEGSISALDYANKVTGAVGSIFILSIITVAYPSLAHLSYDIEKLKAAFSKAMRIIILTALPIMTEMIVLRTPIIKLLFERGAFSSHDTYTTSIALGCLSLGIIGTGMSGLLNRTYYSLKDTKTPVISGVITVCINIVLSIILVRFYRVGGLALASSLASSINTIILLLLLKIKMKLNYDHGLIVSFFKALGASAVMGSAAFALMNFYYRHLPISASFIGNAAGLVLNAAVALIVYLLILHMLRLNELDYLIKFVKVKLDSLHKIKTVTYLNSKHKMISKGINGSAGMNRYAVIMAGGNGTRFWPLSRQHKPKQFLNLSGKDIMLNECIKRLSKLVDINNTMVVANRKQSDIISQVIVSELPRKNILFEPVGRNTAACIAYAAIAIGSRCRDAIMCVFPSDHYIADEDSFREAIVKACDVAEKTEKLITVGIKPTFPSTGYGYISYNFDKYESFEDAHEVINFVEKPDIERARSFFESGNYLWNSGIFVWKVSTILDNLIRYLPKLYKAMMKVRNSIGKKDESSALESAYGEIQSISIDYGILERSDDILVIPGNFGWSDIGNWEALTSILPDDECGNVINAKHVGLGTTKTIIYGSERLIATVGLENMIIADTDDALMICTKDKAQEVKKLVDEVARRGLDQYL